MNVVADSSPLNYLILIDEAEILAKLFSRVLIPEAVFRELRSPSTPPETATWISSPPDWLTVQKHSVEAEGMENLGAGERQAIALALEKGPEAILRIDDGKGRREADRRQIRIMGTLGVLDMAAARSLIDLPKAIQRLLQTTFYVTPNLLKMLLEQDEQRKSPQRKK